ncbi:DUF736 domain-containing protein, partial [Sinorhizobium medicae]|uniref:DUF736 domain-containing protein n=1 Tax=Sinorhizobium medicae TaxID=110321 RepID=UPI003CC56800
MIGRIRHNDKSGLQRLALRKTPSLHNQLFCGKPLEVELGAAWQKRSSESDRDYLSVKLDDPSFPAPIYATLAEVDGEEGLQLI